MNPTQLLACLLMMVLPGLLLAANTNELSIPVADRQHTNSDEWVGLYSSPSEVSRFSRMVLLIKKERTGDFTYRMSFHSDFSISDSIMEVEKHGSCLIDGKQLYLPVAYGFYIEGKPWLFASVKRYTRIEINGQVVLLRDDELRGFRSKKELVGYGVLVRVSDPPKVAYPLDKIEHKPMKFLSKENSNSAVNKPE